MARSIASRRSAARPARTALTAAAAALVAFALPAHAVVYTFSSGDYVPGTTSPSPLSAGDTLNIVGGGNKFFNAVTFTNQGTVNWQADTLYFQSGGTVNNAGLWVAASDDSMVYNGGAQTTFNNTGTFRKVGSSGSTSIGNIAFVNSGLVDVQSGTLVLGGGNVNINAGSQFIGAGSTTVANNATFNGAFTSANLVLSGGTFTGNGAVVNGSVSFTGGTLSGGWQVATGQTLVGNGGTSKLINAGTLTNQGTIDWRTGDALYLQSAGQVANQGTFAVNASMQLLYNGGAETTFNNSALVDVAAGQVFTVGSVRFVNDGGTVRSNGSTQFNGGNAQFNNGSSFVGSGNTFVNTNATFNGGYTSQNLVLAGGTFTGGDGSPGAKAVASGNTVFTGGTFTGNWQLAAGQTLTAAAGGSKIFNGGRFENLGTVAWTTGDAAYLQSGAVIDNRALFTAQESATLAYNGGTATVFNNYGTFSAAPGKTLSVNNVGFVNQAGGIVQAQGTVAFNGNDATFLAGTVFSGAGHVDVNSNASFVGAYSGSNLYLNNGTATGTGAVVNGLTHFTGGQLGGTWQVASGQTLAGESGNGKILNGGTLDNRGTVSWNTADPLYLQSAGQLDNRGTFVATVSTQLAYNGGTATQFNNYGVLRAAPGVALSMNNIGYVNKAGGVVDALGTVNFNGNDAVFEAGSQFTGGGRANVNSNATFIGGYSGSNLYLNGGTFTGNAAAVGGTTHFTGGNLAGTWAVPAGQQLSVESGGSKIINGGTVTNAGLVSINDGQALYLQSSGQLNNSGRLDFTTDGGIYYNGGSATAFVNTGLVVKSGGTGTSVIGDGTGFVNQGVVEVRTGTLQLPSNFTNAGVLKGVGTFAVPGTLTNAGHVAPGASPGTLGLNASYTQTAAGAFDVDVTSASVHDLFNVSGAVTLDGTLNIACFGNCSMAAGTEFVVLDYSGARTGSFASLALSGFGSGSFQAIYDDANTQVLLRVIDATTPAVPEPESWALMLSGMAMLTWLARQRRATPARAGYRM